MPERPSLATPALHRPSSSTSPPDLVGAVLGDDKKSPLFQSINRDGLLTGRQMTRNDVFRMVKRRAKEVGIPESTCNHTFRATGITAYLDNGGTIDNAQAIAAHDQTLRPHR